jgi:hypothetical protein
MASEAELWRLVSNQIRFRHFTISQDCEAALKSFISQGVGEMNRTNYSLAQRDGSKAKLRLVVNEMINLAKAQHSTVLRLKIFEKIKEKLCPLHPFC